MSEVRVAGVTDIPAIVRMGKQFHGLTAYARNSTLDEADVRRQLLAMVRSEAGDVVFVAERSDRAIVGMLGAIVTSPWFNRGYRVMQELFWWVNPEGRRERAGGELLAAIEAWWPKYANGLLMLATPNIEPEKMSRLYRMKGFAPFDTYYAKWKE